MKGLPMKEIPLTRGYVALVDDEDFDRLCEGPGWSVWLAASGGAYARRSVYVGGRWVSEMMHRAILPEAEEVDHRNRNGLDNRRENLRPATRRQNSQNRGVRSDNKSGFKGVCLHRKTGRWCATITVEGRQVWLGLHDSPDTAARVYDEAARAHFGEFAALNFPGPGEAAA